MESILRKWLSTKEILILYGARQIGKTTLIRELIKELPASTLINCEHMEQKN